MSKKANYIYGFVHHNYMAGNIEYKVDQISYSYDLQCFNLC